MNSINGERNKKIALFTPSLEMGGTERVVSILANYFVQMPYIEVHVILISRREKFYNLDEKVNIHEPDFIYNEFGRLQFNFLLMQYLRRICKQIKIETLLSFGGRYNAFSIIALSNSGVSVYITDRSRPGISYGWLLDLINRLAYRRAKGIIAQTHVAANYAFQQTKHKNIKVIPNPIDLFEGNDVERKNVIMNVGRFIQSKNQDELIRIFGELKNKDWDLWFFGDGPELEKCKRLADTLDCKEQIVFFGNRTDVANWYPRASIFAFTSLSEGFPNALAEAMSAGLAVISYACVAGPSDLIKNSFNGYLIEQENKDAFKARLKILMEQPNERDAVGRLAHKSMIPFDKQTIATQILNYILDR